VYTGLLVLGFIDSNFWLLLSALLRQACLALSNLLISFASFGLQFLLTAVLIFVTGTVPWLSATNLRICGKFLFESSLLL
jgi:hypothetical protein